MAKWGEYTYEEVLGYIATNADGTPYHAIRGQGYQQRKEPIKVYKTEERAKRFSPVGQCKKVGILR